MAVPLRRVLAAVVAGAAAFGPAGEAAAQARLLAGATPCAELQRALAAAGEVTIATGPYVYNHYVVACGARLRAVPGYVAARDNPQCLVGYTCAAVFTGF